jgi:hypothetical protein
MYGAGKGAVLTSAVQRVVGPHVVGDYRVQGVGFRM